MTRHHISAPIWFWSELAQVSDEVGVARRGRWLLRYEGWSGSCIESVWDPGRSDEENEAAAYAYAAEQSTAVIQDWQDELAGYELVACGHELTGLYGVTWALFRGRRALGHRTLHAGACRITPHGGARRV
ncbi:MAG: hypothetical protein ABIK62_04935 [candidate division WOR-3 bacterium]